MPLSQKHEAVALAYLTDPKRIGWRAYKKVYPKSSRPAAETSWSALLKNPQFSARIAELGEEAAQGAVATARQVLEELTKIALANMQNCVGAHGQLLGVDQLTKEHAAAVQEYTVDTYTEGHGDDAQPVKRTKLKLADKLGALLQLGRHHKLFTDKTDIDVKISLETLIAQSYQK